MSLDFSHGKKLVSPEFSQWKKNSKSMKCIRNNKNFKTLYHFYIYNVNYGEIYYGYCVKCFMQRLGKLRGVTK